MFNNQQPLKLQRRVANFLPNKWSNLFKLVCGFLLLVDLSTLTVMTVQQVSILETTAKLYFLIKTFSLENSSLKKYSQQDWVRFE